ncbi:MAG: FAD-dependent oxidoreductase [Deltaproteobacteria bacterium]|jgi:nitrite reductase (NADH) large subunit|nr:FAD-dependent oxidoreductase [Deltaproteobacteria bacterium]
MNIVIAGGGVAGVTAAEKAREANPQAHITVFCLEKDALYYRPRLPEIVNGSLPVEKIFAHPDAWYQERRIELRKGETLIEVCADNNQVRGSLGSRLVYDTLLIATGAESSRPAPVNYELPGVFTVRHLYDAMTLHYEAKRNKSAVIMGAGLLALEIAGALGSLGLTVHVLERADRILPRQTTPGSAAILKDYLAKQGLVIHLNASLSGMYGSDRLKRVEISDGSAIETQILVVAAGVTPNLGLAKHMGLKVERGVVVDDFLETSKPGVYAAGDCAQTRDGAGGLWTIGRAEGLIAGHNLAVPPGERKAYQATPPSSTLKVAGLDLVAAGNLDPDGKLDSAVHEAEGLYRKVVVDAGGLLVGYTNLGTTKGNRELAAALGKRKITPDELAALKSPDFDFAALKP